MFGIRSEIKTLNVGKELFYEKNYARTGINTDNDLLLHKPLKFLTIMIRSVLQESEKWKPKIYLDECLYELYKILEYNRLDISEGIDIEKKQMYQKSVKFVIIGTLKILILKMNRIFAMGVMILHKKLSVLMMLLLFTLKEVLTEFTFSIWTKMIP